MGILRHEAQKREKTKRQDVGQAGTQNTLYQKASSRYRLLKKGTRRGEGFSTPSPLALWVFLRKKVPFPTPGLLGSSPYLPRLNLLGACFKTRHTSSLPTIYVSLEYCPLYIESMMRFLVFRNRLLVGRFKCFFSCNYAMQNAFWFRFLLFYDPNPMV